MKRRASVVLLTFCALVGCNSKQGPDERSITGVWEVIEIDREYDSTANADPLPGQFIFTKRHYSIVWMPGNKATEAFAHDWQPTADEKIRRFGEIVVNAGTYELSDELLTIRPKINRLPVFMGGKMTYRIVWSDENLVLTLLDEYGSQGDIAPWVMESRGRIHVKLARLEH